MKSKHGEHIKAISTTEQETWQDFTVKEGMKGDIDLKLNGETKQKIEGLGGTFNEIGWELLTSLDKDDRQEVINEIFNPEDGCKFNFCRLPIGASDFALKWYSHNETPGDFAMNNFSIDRDRDYLIPYIKEAQKLVPDLKLSASPWSPPTWMKKPERYNGGKMRWEEEVLKAYALYFVRFVEEYEKEGINIDQIHVQNEPTADQKFPSCIWNGEEMRDFIRDYLGPAFDKYGIDSEIWLGTINSGFYNDYASIVLHDDKARQYITGVGYQWDGKFAVQRTKIAWPEIKLMQTENECGDSQNTWGHANYVFDLLWHYFTNGVTTYLYWNMILQPGGKSTWGWPQNSMITIDPEEKTITYNPEFYVMKHFSHFVEKGAVRKGLSGSWAGNTLGFENPDGSIVLVINNPFTEKKEISISVKNKELQANLKPDSFNTIYVSNQ
ncbi:MAG: glycoside hydrolase family 30 protein [bacterium]